MPDPKTGLALVERCRFGALRLYASLLLQAPAFSYPSGLALSKERRGSQRPDLNILSLCQLLLSLSWFKLQADVSHVSFHERPVASTPNALGAKGMPGSHRIASPLPRQWPSKMIFEGWGEYWNHCSRLQSQHVAASWLFHCAMTPEKHPTKISSSMNLQVQLTWNLTRGCSLCSARHWPSTSRNLAHLGEVSPWSLPFFYPKKKDSKKNKVFLPTSLQSQHVRHPPCVSSCPPLGARFDGLFRNSRWRRSVSEGNANAERKPFTTSEIQQKLQRGCGCKYSQMAVVEGTQNIFRCCNV